MHMNTIANKNVAASIEMLKTLADPTRYKILLLLSRSETDLCVGEIAQGVGISHSSASHQLAKLEDRGIVSSFRKGQTICYSLTDSPLTERLTNIIDDLER